VETLLDKWGVPQDESNSRGRFIARVPRYLDESLYGEAMKVTLAGEIAGEKIRPVDGLQVR
jgi:starvation-inducible outer membrane lipoprotein